MLTFGRFQNWYFLIRFIDKNIYGPKRACKFAYLCSPPYKIVIRAT